MDLLSCSNTRNHKDYSVHSSFLLHNNPTGTSKGNYHIMTPMQAARQYASNQPTETNQRHKQYLEIQHLTNQIQEDIDEHTQLKMIDRPLPQ